MRILRKGTVLGCLGCHEHSTTDIARFSKSCHFKAFKKGDVTTWSGRLFQWFITWCLKEFCCRLAVHLGLNNLREWPLVFPFSLVKKISFRVSSNPCKIFYTWMMSPFSFYIWDLRVLSLLILSSYVRSRISGTIFVALLLAFSRWSLSILLIGYHTLFPLSKWFLTSLCTA